ncbi:MAG: hypothetical protein AB8G26_02315 [Ilumatobacter sp.]
MTTQPLGGASADSDTLVLDGVTIGVTGQRPRWTVSPWGSITPWGQADAATLEWHVAADDRWHSPADEPTVRQARIDGTPVLETRLRVPDGDAVQRVWAVPEGGGSVVIEFENESPKPFAVALAGAEVITERPPADVPIQGIELDEAIVMPVGHRATVRVVLPWPEASVRVAPAAIPNLPPPLASVRGWTRVTEQASRLVLPDERLVEAVVAARCDLLLEGPIDAQLDPVGFLLDVAELVRCGDSGDAWLLDVVGLAEQVAKTAAKRSTEPAQVAEALEGLAAVRIIADDADDARAVGDVDRTIERVLAKRADLVDAMQAGVARSLADLRRTGSVGRFVRSVERRIADGPRLLVGGLPSAWWGSDFEVHSLPTSPSSTVSFAVRWHGERPAVLFEQHGDPIELTAPDVDSSWRTDQSTGEALWAAPAAAKPARPSLGLTVETDGGSFS